MPASAETKAVADMVRAEQLAAASEPRIKRPPVDYNDPYSPGLRAPVRRPDPRIDLYPLGVQPPSELVSSGTQVDHMGVRPPGSLSYPLLQKGYYMPSGDPEVTTHDIGNYGDRYRLTKTGYKYIGPPGSAYTPDKMFYETTRAGLPLEPGSGHAIGKERPYTRTLPEGAVIGPEGVTAEKVWPAGIMTSSSGTPGATSLRPSTASRVGLTQPVAPPVLTQPVAPPVLTQPVAPQYDHWSGWERGSEGRTVENAREAREGTAGLAAKGRHGDSMLVHMAPEEVAGLASLRQNGVTINPETGLPEMFNLIDLLPTIAGIGATMFGAGPIVAGMAAGATGALTAGPDEDPLMKGLGAGLMTWGMASLGGDLGAAGASATPAASMSSAAAAAPVAVPIATTGAEAGAAVVGDMGARAALTDVGSGALSPAFSASPAFPASDLGATSMYPPDLSAPALSAAEAKYLPPPQVVDDRIAQAALLGSPSSLSVGQVTSPPPPTSPFFDSSGRPVKFAELPPQVKTDLGAGPESVRISPKEYNELVSTKFNQNKNLPLPAKHKMVMAEVNPALQAGSHAAAPFQQQLGNVGKGLERIDWANWSEAATPGDIPLGKIAQPAVGVLAGLPSLFAPEYEDYEKPGYVDEGPYFPEDRRLVRPPKGYIPGRDPQHRYYAMGGTGGKTVRGGLPTLYAQEGVEGMTVEEGVEGSMNAEMMSEIPAGVAATAGIMAGAPPEMQDAVEDRLTERSIEEPQNPRERAIYDRAIMALENELEPEVAQRAIDEFLEVFGPEALHALQEMMRGDRESDRENGGTVETVSGETTVEEGEIQGPDVIAGEIVDPITGEKTGNLRVGENEYIEPAVSLVRRAQVAGLPPTPENGAMVRGEEERMLQQAVG